MVNYHFVSKAGLVEAVVADIRETFLDRLREQPGYAGMSGLDAVLAKRDQLFARPAEPGVRARVLLVLLVEAVGSADGAKGVMAEHLSLVRTGIEEDIRRGVADGSVRPDGDAVAQSFLVESIARGVLLQYQLDSARTRLADRPSTLSSMRARALSAPDSSTTAMSWWSLAQSMPQNTLTSYSSLVCFRRSSWSVPCRACVSLAEGLNGPTSD
ncbi:hypothetical protein [Streptomyces sp. NPDC093094]|uniref:hypothetical protein n=1 Tax=Streptomyces sp. NPDC093094 TaxID=3366026 RepID=UPI003815D02D